jgi:hypothetical protein
VLQQRALNVKSHQQITNVCPQWFVRGMNWLGSTSVAEPENTAPLALPATARGELLARDPLARENRQTQQ